MSVHIFDYKHADLIDRKSQFELVSEAKYYAFPMACAPACSNVLFFDDQNYYTVTIKENESVQREFADMHKPTHVAPTEEKYKAAVIVLREIAKFYCNYVYYSTNVDTVMFSNGEGRVCSWKMATVTPKPIKTVRGKTAYEKGFCDSNQATIKLLQKGKILADVANGVSTDGYPCPIIPLKPEEAPLKLMSAQGIEKTDSCTKEEALDAVMEKGVKMAQSKLDGIRVSILAKNAVQPEETTVAHGSTVETRYVPTYEDAMKNNMTYVFDRNAASFEKKYEHKCSAYNSVETRYVLEDGSEQLDIEMRKKLSGKISFKQYFEEDFAKLIKILHDYVHPVCGGKLGTCVIDCEMYIPGVPCSNINGLITSHDLNATITYGGKQYTKADLKCYVFTFFNSMSIPAFVRQDILCDVFRRVEFKRLVMLNGIVVTKSTESMNLFNMFTESDKAKDIHELNMKSSANGQVGKHVTDSNACEGLMLYSNMPYTSGRKANLYKMKMRVEEQFNIIGVTAQDKVTEPMQGMIVVDLHGTHTTILPPGGVDVYEDCYANPDKYIGKKVEVAFNMTTQNSKGTIGYRHPVAKMIIN